MYCFIELRLSMCVIAFLLVSMFAAVLSCPAQPPPPRRNTVALEGNWTCYYANHARRGGFALFSQLQNECATENVVLCFVCRTFRGS